MDWNLNIINIRHLENLSVEQISFGSMFAKPMTCQCYKKCDNKYDI